MRSSLAQIVLAVAVLGSGACAPEVVGGGGRTGGNRSDNGNGGSPAAPGGGQPSANDADGDGISITAGDCDDNNPLVGPNMVDLPGNMVDDDCDGHIDNAAACDAAMAGQNTGDALAKALGLCDARFMSSASFVGPSDARARNVVTGFGSVRSQEGMAMALLSTGLASTDPGYKPQKGTDLAKSGGSGSNYYANPLLALAAPPPDCGGGSPPSQVNDYTEYKVQLKVPPNASSFSFNFQFFSAEYPEYVCSEYNDRFLVVLEDGAHPAANIAFDSGMNMVSVNNGFFTVCNNWIEPQTKHCTSPISTIAGTGYDANDAEFGGPAAANIGGATAWLTTTAPATPGSTITLRFIIFDEGDAILDSAVLLDNFKWGGGGVTAPSTTVTVL